MLQPLTDAALASVGSEQSGFAVVVPDSTSWIFLDPPSAGRRRFSYRGNATVKPVVLEHGEIVRGGRRPPVAYYLALPYGNNVRAMRELSPIYDLRDERRFARGGYSISMFRMVPKGSVAQ